MHAATLHPIRNPFDARTQVRSPLNRPSPKREFRSSSPPRLADMDEFASPAGLRFAQRLGTFLRKIDLANIPIRDGVLPEEMPVDPFSSQLYDASFELLREHAPRGILYIPAVAPLFFQFGYPFHPSTLQQAFKMPQQDLLLLLVFGLNIGFFIRHEDHLIRTNDCGIAYQRFDSGDAVYALGDFRPDVGWQKEPSPRVHLDHISGECNRRLRSISATGPMVDLGSGSGMQVFTFSHTNPHNHRIIGLETDHRSLNFAHFGAALNGMQDRVSFVDSIAALDQALGGEPLEFAFTNPPFLPFPEFIPIAERDIGIVEKRFLVERLSSGQAQADFKAGLGNWGYGGKDGLRVTRPFTQIFLERARIGSRMMLYSDFTATGDRIKLVEELKDQRNLRFDFEELDRGQITAWIDAAISRMAGDKTIFHQSSVADSMRQAFLRMFDEQGITDFRTGLLTIEKT